MERRSGEKEAEDLDINQGSQRPGEFLIYSIVNDVERELVSMEGRPQRTSPKGQDNGIKVNSSGVRARSASRILY